MADGNTVDGGTFTTPVATSWHTVWAGNTEISKTFRTGMNQQIAGYPGSSLVNCNEITIDKPTRIDCSIENSNGTIKTETAFVISPDITNTLFETQTPTSVIKEYSISVSIVNQLLQFTFAAFSTSPRQSINPKTVGYVKLTKVEQFY